jgi:hypothetical protein
MLRSVHLVIDCPHIEVSPKHEFRVSLSPVHDAHDMFPTEQAQTEDRRYTLVSAPTHLLGELRVHRDEDAMLYEFITTYRDAIITRARKKLTARPWPSASAQELENGVPLFLTQLTETLR